MRPRNGNRPSACASLATLLVVGVWPAWGCRDALGAGQPSSKQPLDWFYTQGQLEPDKVASAWLLTRFAYPGARVDLLPREAAPPAGAMPFDVAFAELGWLRTPLCSTFEIILQREGLEDPALIEMGRMVTESELAFWSLRPGSPEERFDRALKDLALKNDVDAMFRYLDQVHAAGTS